METKLTHAGFFEGIGGFSLGAAWAGMETIYTCEIDDFRNEWLQRYLPNAIHERDIKEAKGVYADVFTAGFPCQDVSIANTTKNAKGLEGKRSGLWYEFSKLISVHRPRYVIIENSPMLVHRGLGIILGQFAQMGYDAEWGIISKRAFGFADERERFILVAYLNEIRRDEELAVFNRKSFKECKKAFKQRKHFFNKFSGVDSFRLRNEAIRGLLQGNAGVSEGVVMPNERRASERQAIEAYGDAICPYVSGAVLEMVKLHHQRSFFS